MITIKCDRCGFAQEAESDDPSIQTTDDYLERMRQLGFDSLICQDCATAAEWQGGVRIDAPADSVRTQGPDEAPDLRRQR